MKSFYEFVKLMNESILGSKYNDYWPVIQKYIRSVGGRPLGNLNDNERKEALRQLQTPNSPRFSEDSFVFEFDKNAYEGKSYVVLYPSRNQPYKVDQGDPFDAFSPENSKKEFLNDKNLLAYAKHFEPDVDQPLHREDMNPGQLDEHLRKHVGFRAH